EYPRRMPQPSRPPRSPSPSRTTTQAQPSLEQQPSLQQQGPDRRRPDLPKPEKTSQAQTSLAGLPPKLRSPPQSRRKSRRPPGRRLLGFDRRLGARFVAGADEAGRGSLAGPLVVAGVLLDYACLREHRVRPLALLNDSKQLDEARREELFRAVVG